MVSKRLKRDMAVLAAGVVIGGVIVCLIPEGTTARFDREKDLLQNADSGIFTNPLLACGDIDSLSVGLMQNLKDEVQSFFTKRISAGHVSHVSVYVRDLNNGPWFGLNEKEPLYPASLLKVPLLLAAYKVEEERPGFLDQEMNYTERLVDAPQLFPPSQPLTPGTYTVRELLRRAIVFSDNNATALLAIAIGPETALKVFEDFGIEKPTPNVDYQMLVRTYASFFRVLYNASYLSRSHSEEALALLAEIDFEDGLVAGVPDGVPVAHKFGEREAFNAENGDIQLHDCGIVYAESPYLICVMAQGNSTEGILPVIREISKKVYARIGDGV